MELHRIIDEMTPEDAECVLDFIAERFESDELTPEEEAIVAQSRLEIEHGFIWGEDFERKLGL